MRELLLTVWKEIIQLANEGHTDFYCGMMPGADMLCGLAVCIENSLQLPSQQLHLHCVAPYQQGIAHWSSYWQSCHAELHSKASSIHYISEHYTPTCYLMCNRYLVDHADVLLAVYDGRPKGSTAATIQYARRQGKKVIAIHPKKLKATIIPAIP